MRGQTPGSVFWSEGGEEEGEGGRGRGGGGERDIKLSRSPSLLSI